MTTPGQWILFLFLLLALSIVFIGGICHIFFPNDNVEHDEE